MDPIWIVWNAAWTMVIIATWAPPLPAWLVAIVGPVADAVQDVVEWSWERIRDAAQVVIDAAQRLLHHR